MNRSIVVMLMFSISSVAHADTAPEAEQAKPPQFIVVSFDATPKRDKIEDWPLYTLAKELLDGQPDGFTGHRPTFTIFYNTAVLQLHPKWRPWRRSIWAKDDAWKALLPPHRKFKANAINHGVNPNAIKRSVEHLKVIHSLGIELANHGVTHAHGGKWTEKRWTEELDEFARVERMFGLPTSIGFRAPFLEASRHTGRARPKDPLFRALAKRGFIHDASKVYGTKLQWPHRVDGTGVWVISVPATYHPITKRWSLFFASYKSYSRPAYYEALMRMFQQRYLTNRAPFSIGGHGEHMGSIKRFLKVVCYLPDVRCASHQQLAEFMEKNTHLENQSQKILRRLRMMSRHKVKQWFKSLKSSQTGTKAAANE